MKPLVIKSYPQKGVVRLRISYYTLSRIDEEVFNDFDYALFRSGLKEIHLNENTEKICNFLNVKFNPSYKYYLFMDTQMCSFSN